jgi:hypothetical protein
MDDRPPDEMLSDFLQMLGDAPEPHLDEMWKVVEDMLFNSPVLVSQPNGMHRFYIDKRHRSNDGGT